MSSTPASLAELLDRAGDREDQRLVEQVGPGQPAETINGWHRGDDDLLPAGRGRRQRRFSLRRPFGS